MKTNYTLIGDVREKLKELPDKSIQMCVTSPPYYALRDYGESNQLGLEDTPEEFVENMVEVFAEVHRVLRDDGTLWLNLGDTYLKNKQLGFIPQRVAIALQEWGWILRQDIIWAKKNCMPESVKDRFTKSHEYIFLFSKQPNYFFNQIREPATQVSIDRSKRKMNFRKITPDKTVYDEAQDPTRVVAADHMRNKRSVWHMRTASYKEAHFAVFPPELAETCIKAGCPEKICAECETPYVQKYEKGDYNKEHQKKSGGNVDGKYFGKSKKDYKSAKAQDASETKRRILESMRQKIDKGLQKQCDCETNETKSGIVLDCFMGSGTTAMVAQDLFRKWIGIELNPEYEKLILKRTSQQVLF